MRVCILSILGESVTHLYEFLSCLPSYRIGPFEVESALMEHPSIAESAVVSSPDPTRGEVKELTIDFQVC